MKNFILEQKIYKTKLKNHQEKWLYDNIEIEEESYSQHQYPKVNR